jgi:ferredoxin
VSGDARLDLVLDPVVCEGRGLCHLAAPHLIELDEWGYPLLSTGSLRMTVDPEEVPAARRAVLDCPALALHLERSASRG